MPKLIFSKNLALCLGVLAMIFSLSYLALAWTEPTLTPPQGNVANPINVSTSTQFKSGSFGIGGVFEADGGSGTTTLLVMGNKVGIGTSDMSKPEYSPLTVFRTSTSTRNLFDANVASFVRKYTNSAVKQSFSIYLFPVDPDIESNGSTYLNRTAMLYCPTDDPVDNTDVLQFSNPSNSVKKPNPIIRFNMGEEWANSAGEKLVITTSTVRIGNPDEDSNLKVIGKINATGDICTDAGGGKCLSSAVGGGTNYWTLNGSDISNNNSGSVGIGTVSPPSYKLHVNSSTGYIAGFGDGRRMLNILTGVGFASLGSRGATDSLRLYAGNDTSKGISINGTDGNVGVGITTPSQKLDVSGQVRATDFCTTGGKCLSAINNGGYAAFGGIYTINYHDSSCRRYNPMTGTCDCPTGYAKEIVAEFVNLVCDHDFYNDTASGPIHQADGAINCGYLAYICYRQNN